MKKKNLLRTAALIMAVTVASAAALTGCADVQASQDSSVAETENTALEAPADGEVPPDMPGERPEDMPGEPPEGGAGGPGGQEGPGGAPEGMPGGGSQSAPDSYEAVQEYTEDTELSGETIDSTGTDENAVLVTSGAMAELDDMTVSRVSDDSTGGDSASFYGVGAAVLVTDGTAVISDSEITTDAKGGAGVFAYGDGVAYVADTKITTQQDTSGGIHAAGGGTLYAFDLEVETNGESSAAIRSDRGGGTMVVDGGTYTSHGPGSPAVYSTADITVSNAVLTATGSEAVCIEGLNSLRLYDCTLSGSMADQSQNDCTWNIILYQSMSGDSELGCSTFVMDGGEIAAENGGIFYSTNTESEFVLRNVEITYPEDCEFLLKVTGNSNARGWGSSGNNGANTVFTAISQALQGDVYWDSISTLDLYLTEGSTLQGAVIDDESNAGSGGNGYCSLYIDGDSEWIVTGDSTVTNLCAEGTVRDADGNTVTIADADGSVLVEGDSAYTVTVTGTYAAEADTSGAGTIPDQDSVTVEMPE